MPRPSHTRPCGSWRRRSRESLSALHQHQPQHHTGVNRQALGIPSPCTRHTRYARKDTDPRSHDAQNLSSSVCSRSSNPCSLSVAESRVLRPDAYSLQRQRHHNGGAMNSPQAIAIPVAGSYFTILPYVRRVSCGYTMHRHWLLFTEVNGITSFLLLHRS
jgi:hypothetical protein